MKPAFDQVLKTQWEDLSASGVKQPVFVTSHMQMLALFMSEDDMKQVMEAGDDYEKVHGSVKRILESSAVGQAMYRHAWLRVSRGLFVDKVKQNLRNLEHLDFREDEVATFKTLSGRSVADLVAQGHQRFDRWTSRVSHLSQDVVTPMDEPNDEWFYRFASHVKSAAINAGLLPMLPHEKLLFSVGSVLGVASQCRIPDSVLAEFKCARQAASDLLGDRTHQLEDMIGVLMKGSRALKSMDRSFEIDLLFIERHAPTMLLNRLHDMALASLPSPDADVTMAQALLPFLQKCGTQDDY